MPKTLPKGAPGGTNGTYRIVVHVEKRNRAEPRDRNHHGDEQRDREPARDLNSARVQICEHDQHQARARPFCVTRERWKINPEVVHHQHAVETVEQKRAGPIPPAALKAPEIAEGSAAPAIEAALHGEKAVEFGGGEGNRNAPEKRNEGEEDQRHAGAGIVKDAFVTEGAAGGVAVENAEQREETDLAQARAVGGWWLLGFSRSCWHRAAG